MNNSRENNDLQLPPIIFGTSGLGNIYQSFPYETKLEIIKQSIAHTTGVAVFDSAGKYGAGLSLEVLGKSLNELAIRPEDVVISNKLGWFRVPLTSAEPTFEPGIWKDLEYDAVQKISYEGILECYHQGNELLGQYIPQMLSVHDPDEYLAKAKDDEEYSKLYQDILDAYKALYKLKAAGKAKFIGVGAKNWRIIEKISKDIDLDWVMFANSMTIKSHPQELLLFMQELENKGVTIINSAIYHGGFLLAGDYYDYKLIKPDNEDHKAIFQWREDFFVVCEKFKITPAEAALQFALQLPGVKSVALSTTNPARIEGNIQMAYASIPTGFWEEMKSRGLIKEYINYL
jgi:D-threo-aldose 1-dehydrogenase